MIYKLKERRGNGDIIKVNTSTAHLVGGWDAPVNGVREDLYVTNRRNKGEIFFIVKTNTEKKDENGDVETKAKHVGYFDAKDWVNQKRVDSRLAKKLFGQKAV